MFTHVFIFVIRRVWYVFRFPAAWNMYDPAIRQLGMGVCITCLCLLHAEDALTTDVLSVRPYLFFSYHILLLV